MNPMMLVQGAAAVTGLIGGLIPDKERTITHTNQTEGSELSGRVPGVIGPLSERTFTKEKYQGDFKSGLLKTSAGLGLISGILPTDFSLGEKTPKPIMDLSRGLTDMQSMIPLPFPSTKESALIPRPINIPEPIHEPVPIRK